MNTETNTFVPAEVSYDFETAFRLKYGAAGKKPHFTVKAVMPYFDIRFKTPDNSEDDLKLGLTHDAIGAGPLPFLHVIDPADGRIITTSRWQLSNFCNKTGKDPKGNRPSGRAGVTIPFRKYGHLLPNTDLIYRVIPMVFNLATGQEQPGIGRHDREITLWYTGLDGDEIFYDEANMQPPVNDLVVAKLDQIIGMLRADDGEMIVG